MADITIKDLTAGTPILTDLLIFANPTTGLAKKATLSTFKSSLSLVFADLNDYAVANLLDEQILIYDSGDWKNSSLKTINGNSLLGSGNIAIATGLTSLNTLTASTQTFAVGTSGTDFTISSATSTHTFNLPSASAANRGLLTAANWTTFNNKVGGSGTTNYLSKFTAAGTIGNSLITDDGTTLTLISKTVINGSLTASSALARYVYLNPTLSAAANNDMLVGLDINPTYTNGAYTGIGNIALRIGTESPTTASRWGIYQGGANDNNYFAAPMSIGNSIADFNTYKLNVTGNAYISGFLVLNTIFATTVATNEIKPQFPSPTLEINTTGGTKSLTMYDSTGNIFIGITPTVTTRKLTVRGEQEWLTTVSTGTHTTSGNHLPIWVNGVKYWLALLNPTP